MPSSNVRPVLYVKTGCPWCEEAEEFLKTRGIAYDRVDVTRDPQAFARMQELSGQTKAPTLDWDGEILADFGAAELAPFLKEHDAL
jgi:glutaredoxin 3